MDEDYEMVALVEKIESVIPVSYSIKNNIKGGSITVESDGLFSGEYVVKILEFLPKSVSFFFSNTEDNRVRMILY
jgi:hypothetical protein